MNTNIAEAGAAQTAGNLANINLQNAQLGRRIGFRLRASWLSPQSIRDGYGRGQSGRGPGSAAMGGATDVKSATTNGKAM